MSKNIKIKEQLILFKRLSLYANAGLPIMQCMHSLQVSKWSKSMKAMIDRITIGIKNGQQLSAGMTGLNPIITHMITIGERSGTLAASFAYICTELEKQRQLKNTLMSALIYPVIVFSALIAILTVILVYVFPKITPVFQSFHATLPITTRILIRASNTLRDHYIIVPIVCISFGIACYSLFKIPTILTRIRNFAFQLPIVGTCMQYASIYTITRTIGHLTSNHVPLVDAIQLTTAHNANPLYTKQLNDLYTNIRLGKAVSDSFQKYPQLYPDVVIQIIQSGEQTGTLSESFLHIAAMYEQELTTYTEQLTQLIEPFLMISIGILVGGIAISVITPLYAITQNL